MKLVENVLKTINKDRLKNRMDRNLKFGMPVTFKIEMLRTERFLQNLNLKKRKYKFTNKT